MKACLLISYAKADIFKMHQTAQFFRTTSDKTQNRSFLSSLERRFGNSLRPIRSGSREITTAPRFEIESRTINNIRGNPIGTEKEKK